MTDDEMDIDRIANPQKKFDDDYDDVNMEDMDATGVLLHDTASTTNSSSATAAAVDASSRLITNEMYHPSLENFQEACKRLHANDPKLYKVSLSYRQLNTGPGLVQLTEAMMQSTHIRYLCLDGCLAEFDGNDDDMSASVTQEMSSSIRFFCEHVLSNHPSLTHLYMIDNNLRDVHATAIANALQTNPRIQVLSLYGNLINDDGIRALMDALRTQTSGDGNDSCSCSGGLRELYLDRNLFGVDGCNAIASLLRSETSCRLKVLSLDHVRMTVEGATALFQNGVHHNKSLYKLSLNRCFRANPDAIVSITDSLLSTPSNEDNGSDDEDDDVVSDVEDERRQPQHNNRASKYRRICNRSSSPSVRVLALGENNLKDRHAIWIADALIQQQQHQHPRHRQRSSPLQLIDLDLSFNLIRSPGIRAISYALQSNTKLQRLRVGNNRFGVLGMASLIACLRHINYTLVDVRVHGNTNIALGSKKQRLKQLCCKNKRIKQAYAKLMRYEQQQQHERHKFQQRQQHKQDGVSSLRSEGREIPLAVWPYALQHVHTKFDLLYSLLRSKPQLCQHPNHQH